MLKTNTKATKMFDGHTAYNYVFQMRCSFLGEDCRTLSSLDILETNSVLSIMRMLREALLVYAKLFMCVDSYRHDFLSCQRVL